MPKNKNLISRNFYEDIRNLLATARNRAYKAVNSVMVEAYWNVGRRIVEEEQKGKKRAAYREYLIKNLSKRLTIDFDRGFSEQSLRNMRQFYLQFSIRSTLWSELTWSHFKLLIRVENENARKFYGDEAVHANWSVRALERQINSLYFERLLSSRNRTTVRKEANAKTGALKERPFDFIKDPFVLEFAGLQEVPDLQENKLEQALIDHLQKFILELGRGFAFVARQRRISTDTKNFYIDLVFYNYLLKCFVLIDLKKGELTHQDIGQMDMYVRLFEDKMKNEGDNPTIGIILCAEKDEVVVKYSVLKDNKKLFASKYKLYLPTEQELIEEIEREKQQLKMIARDPLSRDRLG